jgi:hypothetical protein
LANRTIIKKRIKKDKDTHRYLDLVKGVSAQKITLEDKNIVDRLK